MSSRPKRATTRSSAVQNAIDDQNENNDYIAFNKLKTNRLAPPDEEEEVVEVTMDQSWASDSFKEDNTNIHKENSNQGRNKRKPVSKPERHFKKKKKNNDGCRYGHVTGVCRSCFV